MQVELRLGSRDKDDHALDLRPATVCGSTCLQTDVDPSAATVESCKHRAVLLGACGHQRLHPAAQRRSLPFSLCIRSAQQQSLGREVVGMVTIESHYRLPARLPASHDRSSLQERACRRRGRTAGTG